MFDGQRILVIEDEPLIAIDLESALLDAGAADVEIAPTLERAVEAVEETFAAAIVDLRLNGQSVRPAVERLVARAIPFVFFTGADDTPTARAWPSVPIARKPSDARVVVELLHALVKGPSAAA